MAAPRYERRSNFGGTGHEIYDFIGKSTDTKPTGEDEKVGAYSLFFELDTGKVYYYDTDASTWREKV